MRTAQANNMAQLLDNIGAGVFDPSDPGPKVISVMLNDGRSVVAHYYRGPKTPDVTSRRDYIDDDEAMRPHASALLETGTTFITETGSHDMVCTLEWSIEPKAS